MKWQQLTSLIVIWLVCVPLIADDEDSTSDPLPDGAVMRLGTTRMQQSTWPTCVQFAPNDQVLATADYSGKIHFWDVATGKLLRESPTRKGQTFAFSPDGKTMAIGGHYNQAIALWDLKNHREIRELPQSAWALAFSSDGKMLASAGQDKIVRLWNANTGELIHEMKGHQSQLYAVAFSPNNRTLASAGGSGRRADDKEIRLWYVPTGRQYATLLDDNDRLNNLPDTVYSLAFSRDGKTLGACGPYVTRLWDVDQEQLLQRLEDCSYVVAFSPTEDRLVTGGNFGIYDSHTAKQKIKLAGQADNSGSVAYSHDGKWIASCNRDGFVQLWDAHTGKEIVKRFGHEGGVRAGAFSPDGTLIASISRQDATLRIWGTASGKELLKFPVPWQGSDVWWNEEGSSVWFAPYGREVLTWTYNQQVVYWRIATQDKHVQQLETGKSSYSYDDRAVVAAYSPDGQRMATSSHTHSSKLTVCVFELDGGRLLANIQPLAGISTSDAWVSSLALSPDGKLLAIGALNGSHRDKPGNSVQLWDLEKNKRIHHLRSATSPPGNVCFSPDGKLLATSSTIGAPVQVWRVSDGKEVAQFPAEIDFHGRDMAPLAFSPDGSLLAAADKDRVIYVWELATKKRTHTFTGHLKAVTSLAFSPDGKTLLSSSEDTTLLLWNVRGATDDYADKPLTVVEMTGYWQALADRDSDVATKATQALMNHSDQTVAWIETHLTAGPVLDEKEIPQLIQALENANPQTHLPAVAQLKRFGSAASPALFTALSKTSDRKFRQRIESILNLSGKFPKPPEQLQRLRAVSILEKLDNPTADAILKTIADHEPPTETSQEAQAALKRLDAYRRAPSAGRP
ncbi:hypothetical protein C5Y96_07710 [Blastopirellula marina]|uniref:Uncharacterized protein n=1 Tax=Blastopirellula marina TaxID=124 RepID=A0A2S8FXX9_9BACT|nr:MULTISPECIES: WD40 repeat domain-containing protein [Pirellulaceae]PQO37035.1 hypothetical protein C5Y96_07710 [Blastopirellula marina]RCS53750.1 WD40 repeat domain-containing protein [Bremerella cremea]